jgi:hypothetical protein
MSEEKKYDTYGFPIPRNNEQNGNKSDIKKYLKVFGWVLFIMFLLLNVLTGSLAGYLSFYEFQNDSLFVRVLKMGIAVCLNWVYLGWKALQKLRGPV